MARQFSPFIEQHAEFVQRLEKMLTTDPAQVIRSARQAIRQFEFFAPADAGEEAMKELAIEVYEDFIARAESVIKGQGGQS
ncbi:hypothetical protein [Methylobacterium nodulans]|uniref:Uncharacterized protein n=1 Tax=Methylobacterium nodulans (strain LMG 21967 / CNCM I-2342 / ORS 2060) TaxID=460265 RepID=B8IY11_METNO|nr:hypothetical protein [Methylobacterium nodulans]ACL63301.1 hypothetical protein Mnod_7708 [Methylobacterium nodulans ORS 2060]